jgi:hypothetical protein
MQTAVVDSSRATSKAPQLGRTPAPTERLLTVDQLARAVGEHALRQAEIDQKIATRLLELRDELSASREEVRLLRSQINQLVQGLAQGLALARQQAANATQSSLQASVAGLRSR